MSRESHSAVVAKKREKVKHLNHKITGFLIKIYTADPESEIMESNLT